MAATAPRRPRGILRPLWTVVRIVLCTIAFGAFAFTSTVDDPSTPQMYLVDDGGGDSSVSEPPYTPSESEGGGSPSDKPGGGDGEQDGEKPGGEKESEESSGLASLPLAAEAGISLGVIMLGGLALIPGRRPPASMRG